MNTEPTKNATHRFSGQRYHYPSREELHKRYGGRIYASDFEVGNYRLMSDYAARIASDHRFDEMCRKDYERNKAFKARGKRDQA